MTKHNAKLIVVCFSLLGLSVGEGLYGELLFLGASANNTLTQADVAFGEIEQNDSELTLIAQNATDSSVETEDTVVEEIPVDNVNEVSSEDYLIPKTVYIGVDSIASPEVVPEIVAEPEQIDTQGALVDEQSIKPLESSNEAAAVAQPGQAEQTSQENNSATAVNTQTIIKAPEIQQVKTESINSVAKRITLFKSIDVDSELDVPAGLPEDLNGNQDDAEAINENDSQVAEDNSANTTQGKLSETENQLSKVENQPEKIPAQNQEQNQEQLQVQASADENVVDEATKEGSAEDPKKPAVVVNINDSLQIDSRNEWGWTKIMSASIEGNLQRVNELLAQGANPDIAGEDGRSPLMAASWNKHYKVVDSLINAGADVNLVNRDGWTALSFAAWNGDLVIVRSLLRFAANKFIKTADGFTPLELAEQKGHQEIVELLK